MTTERDRNAGNNEMRYGFIESGSSSVRRLWMCFALMVLAAGASPSWGHETDQYTVPLGREFADLRMFFARDVHGRLSHAVESLNRRIEATLADGKPTPATERYYESDTVVRAAFVEFPPVMFFIEQYDMRLHSQSVRDQYPGLVVAHVPGSWIYHHWALIIDPTKLVRLRRCSTIMVDGTYFGTDKLAHFIHMGYMYHSVFHRARSQGGSEREAIRRAVGTGTGANLFLSENTLLGRFTTGVRSNGDLAANYCGFKFFRNLTEPVRLRGEMRPPMLVREGAFWKLNDHVCPNSDFFSYFISDHWNEALNPNVYNAGVGACVRSGIRDRCERLVDWYRDKHGRRRTAADFSRMAHELSTYYGEDYGHSGNVESLVQIANTCFDGSDARPARRARAAAGPTSADAHGRTALWWAAYHDDLGALHRLILAGADVNAADIGGETPLHCAARWGHSRAAERLLQAGADPNAASSQGMTPLHLAARELRSATVALLLSQGADPGARDQFGCVPLHDAAAKGDRRIVDSLLRTGADPDASDLVGTTPLHRAARAGQVPVARVLLAAGADPAVANAVGRRPYDEAWRGGFTTLAELLEVRSERSAARLPEAAPDGEPATESQLVRIREGTR